MSYKIVLIKKDVPCLGHSFSVTRQKFVHILPKNYLTNNILSLQEIQEFTGPNILVLIFQIEIIRATRKSLFLTSENFGFFVSFW